jgi:DMSO reductase family type II enzyme chaperone
MDCELVQVGDERAAAARSRTYQLLGGAFAFPDEALFAAVGDGTFADMLGRLCLELPFDLTGGITLAIGLVPESYAEFESEYIRLFDVGAAGPPCPLYGGVYGGDRMKVMEDAVRFYNFFGLRLSPQARELPDHLTTELEFMHYLTYREALAQRDGLDPAPLLRAERDFLARHLHRWVPRLEERLRRQSPPPFFAALARFAALFIEADHAHTTAAAPAA